MIKELKVNFYRIIRSKSFIVILILLLLGAVFSSLMIKFLADDPFDLLDKIRVEVVDSATTEEDVASFNSFFDSIDSLRDVNKLSGVVRMTMCSDLVCFLHCIFVALFISAEYKSRYHVNHFSLSPHPARVVFLEWISLAMAIVLVELVRFTISLGLSVLMCSSFEFDDVVKTSAYLVLVLGIMIVFASFAFMIAFLRRSGGLSIVLSSLFCFGVVDFIFGVLSVWLPWTWYLSLNNILNEVAYNRLSSVDYLISMVVVVLYCAVFLTISLAVAAKRDPY